MFRGTFATTIDPKGRTSIPARFRETLVETFGDERFFVTKCPGADDASRGLVLYPYRELLALEEKVAAGGTGLSAAQLNSVRRLVLAPAVECTADGSGRVLIPPPLRSYAGLERDIVFVGVQRKAEIWSSERWDSVCAQAEKDFPADTSALAELGF
ncbi:MAG TPA: division/cell wall cluster transcriptional repressor MraZ [Verrucomicrobiae bacterium]|nr:division/cell wall cluster transcriptional repressor MraZ [Verrucomicrobiae bacterium]